MNSLLQKRFSGLIGMLVLGLSLGWASETPQLPEDIFPELRQILDAAAKQSPRMMAKDLDALVDVVAKGPATRLAHPSLDHYLPLLIIAGASELSQDRSHIAIVPVHDERPVRRRHRIKDLVAASSAEAFKGEFSWGKPQGREVW